MLGRLTLALALALGTFACEEGDFDDGPGGGTETDTVGGSQDSTAGGGDTTAGGGDTTTGGTDAGTTDGKAAWTIFVYGHADHNLSPSLVRDMVEMNKAVFGDHIRMIVMADWDASADTGTGENYATGTEWYRVLGSDKDLIPYETTAEQNLDDPKVLRASIAKAFKANPAKHYGLILWDHGGAWNGGFGHDGADGGKSGEAGQGIGINDLVTAIGGGLADAGISGTRPLDFLSFDTCLMAGAEVAVPFRDIAKVFIANAEIDYGDGWDYTAVLNYLDKNPGVSAIEFAKAEVAAWDKHHLAAGLDDKLIRSHVALDMSKTDAFLTAVKGFATLFATSKSVDMLGVGLGTVMSLPVYSAVVGDPTEPSRLRDLGQFLDQAWAVGGDDALATEADKARKALAAMIIDTSVGTLRQAQKGVHVQIGLANELVAEEMTAYGKKADAWNKVSGWKGLLDTIVAANDNKAPTLSASAEVPAAPTENNPPKVSFSVADKDVAIVDGTLLMTDPNQANLVYVFGSLGMGPIDPGTYTFGWDMGIAGIRDASDEFLPITLLPWLVVGTKSGEFDAALLAFSGQISDPATGEKMACTFIFDGNSETVSKVAIGQGSNASVMTLAALRKAAPKATVTPTLMTVNATTGQTGLKAASKGSLIPASGAFKLDVIDAPSGNYTVMIKVTDVFGNAGYANAAITLPDVD